MNDTLQRETRNQEHNVEDADPPLGKDNSCTLLQKIFITLNIVCHVLVVFVNAYILCYIGWFQNATSFTSLHATLCTIGYALFMTEAIIGVADENIWSSHLNRRSRSHAHWILQVLGAICSISGVAIKYVGNEQSGRKRHFRSNHALVGIISAGGIFVLALSGLPALFAPKIRKIVRPVIVKFIHNVLGIVCFVLGMYAIILAYKKRRYFTDVNEDAHLICTVATYIATILALIGAVRSLGRQFLGIIKISTIRCLLG